MSRWKEPIDPNRMRHELENIYMLASKKIAVRHHYPEGFPKVPAVPIGPASDDPDWDHIVRFCEQAGLQPTILRTDTAASPAAQQEVNSGEEQV